MVAGNRLDVLYVGDYFFACMHDTLDLALLYCFGLRGTLVIAKNEILKLSISFWITGWLLCGFHYLQVGHHFFWVQGILLLNFLKSLTDFVFEWGGEIRCFCTVTLKILRFLIRLLGFASAHGVGQVIILEFANFLLWILALKVFKRISFLEIVVSKKNSCIVESWKGCLPLLRFKRFSARVG